MEKNIKRLAYVVIISMLIVSIFKIYKLNNEYPIRHEKYIDLNETAKLDGDIYMTIKNIEIPSDKEKKELYEKCELETEHIVKNVLVSVELENKSTKEAEYELYKLYIETSHNKVNGIIMELFFELNDCDMILKIPAKDKKEVVLPYEITDDMLSVDEGRNINGEGMYLVMKRYPIKEFWKLHS